MFKADLQEKLSQIFGLKKVTFDIPSDSYEQDTLFVEVAHSRSRISGEKINAKVMGSVFIFSQKDKLPFGFFSKRIEQAPLEAKKDLFFYAVDTENLASPSRIQNISERRSNFVYLHSAQYDPNQGSLTNLVIGG